ncbi:uncharacterized protein LOC143301454 [Babylonia areolata]|uniref:uncharacterized protein LOC143301454 n=1 Tax=Babylonia areolata TaxID=304850 RepID=UPI003FD06ACB
MWFENFTTLYIKYQLVQDLQLRGLSIWYGEDLVVDMSVDDTTFTWTAWDFLTHHVLHKAAFHPVQNKHVYADTVAWVSVGCLLLGIVLGVTFTCIAFRRKAFRRPNRPFKLDEVDDDFRDDEGL